MKLDKIEIRALVKLQIDHYNKLGYDRSTWLRMRELEHRWYMDYLDEITSYLPKGNIFEVGCGGGYFTTLLKIAGYHVIGGDIMDPETAAGDFWFQQRKLKQWPEYIGLDGRFLPFKEASFDGIICVGVLEHIGEKRWRRNTKVIGEENTRREKRSEKRFLREISRVLRPEGFFFIYELPKKIGYEHIVRPLGSFTLSPHSKFYDEKEIGDVLVNAGFRIMSVQSYEYVPKGMLKWINPSEVYLLSKRLRLLKPLARYLRIVAYVEKRSRHATQTGSTSTELA
jgi:SAM-dependent methyltransferase